MAYGIVVSDINDWTAKSLQTAFLERKEEAAFLDFSGLSAHIGHDLRLISRDTDMMELDAVVVRDLGRGKPADVAFRFEVLRALEEEGVRIINPPEAIAKAANKFATSIALKTAGIPTPATVVTSSSKAALEFLSRYESVVSKPLFGYKGRGIVMLTQKDQAALQRIIESQGIAYLQEFVDLESPRDIRAFVVDGVVLGAIYRVAPDGAWISNLAKGGVAKPCAISQELKDLAVRASRAVGTIYCGVDLLETSEGLKVIEVNGTPSGKGIFDALEVDVASAIANYTIGISPPPLPKPSK